SGFKKFRVTVNAANDQFEVRIIGWNRNINDWDTNNFEQVFTFQDSSLPTGRIGVGDWGMGAFGAWNATIENPPTSVFNPIGAGIFLDNIRLETNGVSAFSEDWETATLHTVFPAGWENPYSNSPPGTTTIIGDW